MYKIAELFLESGDEQRALKFVKITKRSDPTIPTDNLQTSKPTPQRENHHMSQRTHQPETSINYTEEHVRVVHEIRKNKDYYAILGVEKSSSAEEIKAAYKKLCLKIHPDKNNAPGAEEAFKYVSKAFNCLNNEQSKRNYDQTGSENGNYTLQNEIWVEVVSLVVVVVLMLISGYLLLDILSAEIKRFLFDIYQTIYSWLRSAYVAVLTVSLAFFIHLFLSGIYRLSCLMRDIGFTSFGFPFCKTWLRNNLLRRS